MYFPKDVSYSRTHEWVRMADGNTARVGITDYAQHELGDLVFVNLPEVGDEAIMGERIADVESVKAVSDIFSPLSGRISAVNGAILDAPELLNSDPYGAWLFEVRGVTEHEDLMGAEDYERFCEKGE
ncbi:MAG: glycine cleavage system protein GcvH [Synergistaceae bacterium]|jgi:glycine cleavage system H protein|nr:glycine cleavage system protein GcvH [Synergistaceae bacterium]